MSEFVKTRAPVILGFVLGMFVFANYFISDPTLSTTVSLIRNQTIIIAAFAIGLGAINLSVVNYRYITTRRPGLWMFAPIFLILFPVLSFLGIIKSPIFSFVYSYVNVPTSVAITAFVSIFIMQGMYRAVKIRNIESLLLTGSTVLIMLRKIPLGVLIWQGFLPIGDWLLFVTAVAGIRALSIIYALGIISMGIRAMIGHEKSQLGIAEGAPGEK